METDSYSSKKDFFIGDRILEIHTRHIPDKNCQKLDLF